MRRLLIFACLTSACGVDLAVPPGTQVNCTRDADCTDGLVCAPLVGRCVASIDALAPSIVNAEALGTDRVRVVYSEPVVCGTVSDSSAYTISPSLAVVLAAGEDCDDAAGLTTEALLFTVNQSAGETYMLVAHGVVDDGGNALADNGSRTVFTGFGQKPDASPPRPLTPADHARVLGAHQGLAWTFRPGATFYSVEVATDPSFATQVVGSPFLVASPATTLELRDLNDVTYYWRIRSDLTAPSEVLPVNDFDVLIDTVYVACPGTAPCSDAGVHNGSRTRPYSSVQRALTAAAELSTSLDVPTVGVAIAARGPTAAYEGPVLAQWQSVAVTGGWDATFTTRNPDPAVTVIESDSVVMILGNFPQPIIGLVEGLTLRSTALAPRNAALQISSASSALTVRNVAVRGATNPLNALVQIIGGPAAGPVIDGCSFIADINPGEVGRLLHVKNASPRITSSEIRFGTTTGADSALALHVEGPLPGEVLVEHSILVSGNATQHSDTVLAEMAADSLGGLTLRDVLATSGSAESSQVLTLLLAPRVAVENSVLSASAGTVRCHVIGETLGTAQVAFRNSVLQAGSCPSTDGETVQLEGGIVMELTNDVIIGPTGGAPPLRILDSHPIVTNTIVVPRSGAICVDQPWDIVSIRPTWGTPTAFQNNVLAGCSQPYVIANSDDGDPAPTVATTGSAVDGLSGLPLRSSACSDATCPQARFVANVVLPATTLGDLFVDVDGPDNDLLTIADNDYHLRATANIAVRQGGLGPGVAACAPLGELASCNVPPLDFDGQTRTAPYSIGPDEAP